MDVNIESIKSIHILVIVFRLTKCTRKVVRIESEACLTHTGERSNYVTAVMFTSGTAFCALIYICKYNNNIIL